MTDETRYVDPDTGGEKGAKKARYDLLPVRPMNMIAEHFAAGADKYADHNYRRGYPWSLSYAAAMRHMAAFWDGESYDAETGTHHLAAVAFHCMAMMEYDTDRPRYGRFDDRWCSVDDYTAGG